MIGNGSQTLALNNSKLQLELYIEIVEARTEGFTLDSLRSLVERYKIISKISDHYFSISSEEMEIPTLRQMATILELF
jgi:hypothetical protein